MFVTRKSLVAFFAVGFGCCLLFIIVVNPFDKYTSQIGTTNIFLSPSPTESSKVKTKSEDISNSDDTGNDTETVSVTETVEKETQPESPKQEETKVIDLALSSPQPSTTLYPRGKGPESVNQEPKHKIPDSNLHIKDTQQVLDFVHHQCEKFNQTTALPGEAKKPRLLIVPKNWREHRILYASNPKTGSTSFKKWYCRIQGDERPYASITNVHAMGKYGKFNEVFDWVEEDLGREAQLIDAARPLYKVVAVRNPLTKLMSGFRDKILRRTKTGIKEPMLQYNPDLNINSTDAEKYAAFVEAVVNRKIVNMHFTPQWQKMKVCDFPYDMIMQTETTNQQIKEVQKKTHTEEFEFPGSRSEQGYDSVATVHLAHEFYSKVRPELMEKLYHYFRWDFILLGYTKLDNPNFPYLDFDQDIDKEFGDYVKDEVKVGEDEPASESPSANT